jgi:glycosyltransferase involved in cell wall biosynthesis
MKTSRIGIDCRLAGSRHAGIGRYIKNLIQELVLCKTETTTWVVFFSDLEQQQEVLPSPPANWEVVFAPIRHYSLQEQLKMPAIFAAAKLDLLHVPHFNVPLAYRGKLIVTIHDLLWHEQRGTTVTTLSPVMYWLKYAFYHLIVRHAVTVATTVIVPAKTIRDTVAHYYPHMQNKIFVTYEGIDRSFTNHITQSRKTNHDEYALIYTGSLYPHKNIKVVLQLLQQQPNITLTIIGSRSVFRDQIEQQCLEMAIADQVTFAGYVPDEKLATLYQQADALVQPSLSEGFGLTGLEALATGLPAIVSDIPIFREIYQDSAIYFIPSDPVSVYEALQQAVEQRTDLIHRAAGLLKRYSWQTMTEQVLHIYSQALTTR